MVYCTLSYSGTGLDCDTVGWSFFFTMSYDRLVSQLKSSVGGVDMTLTTPYEALLSYWREI